MPAPLTPNGKQPETIHLRIGQPEASNMIRLAHSNRRSIQVEGLIAIEAHLASNRRMLKNGDKLPRRAK